MKNILYDWGKEFLDLQLGDKRLYERFVKMMDFISVAPNQSLLLAGGSRNMAKAMYRFVSNEKIQEEKLIDSIAAATREKIIELNDTVILCVQDTSSLSFGRRNKIEGMGYYCDSQQKGMNVHTCIAVTQDGLPIGILHQQCDTRKKRKGDIVSCEKKKGRHIEEKESFRWIETLKSVNKYLPRETKCIHICDREGDFYEFFSVCQNTKRMLLS